MSEEKKMILEMVKDGKISTDEAEKLLEKAQPSEELSGDPSPAKSRNQKFLRIQVTEDGKKKVNINIPIALAEVGLKLIPEDKLTIEGKKISAEYLMQLIEQGNEGELVNIDTVEKGKDVHIKIFID